MSKIIEKINKSQLKANRNVFNIGDSVCVHTIVKEGDKERVQKFTGVVIGRRGTDINANFTVRRISYGEGVERVFPLHSPRISKIVVENQGSVRRSKLKPERWLNVFSLLPFASTDRSVLSRFLLGSSFTYPQFIYVTFIGRQDRHHHGRHARHRTRVMRGVCARRCRHRI